MNQKYVPLSQMHFGIERDISFLYHIISNFNESRIFTKSRLIQMDKELFDYCVKEINDLLKKNLICLSKSPWSCSTFYVNNSNEKERGAPKLVINYKPLNKVLHWI